jgi:ATP-dependent protease HslVU (ClpYQ) peptidase subunit
MTIWVYRNGILASDSAIFADTLVVGTIRKVAKKGGWLAAGAGNARDMALFLDTFEANIEEAGEEFTINSDAKLENLGGLLVSPEGRVFQIDSGGYPYECEAEFHSGGIGEAMAIGAMAMGATAEEAVQICIDYNAYCDGAIQVVRLDSVSEKE